jgi:AraC family transcriptional regulator of adaptative response/methylated-DNA-[protein]-cysteine methyltransferase
MIAQPVILDAATADAIAARGAGLTLHAGSAASPFGPCLIAETTRGICHLAFFDTEDRAQAIAELAAAWPLARLHWDEDHAIRLTAQIFDSSHGCRQPLKVHVRGTAFQLRVWRALLQVPPTTRISYGQLAAAAGKPLAYRATGTALGHNPVAFLIPCHRVTRADGTPGNYRWGSARKRAILAWENHHAR